ncbi:MAG: hypothetical protein PVI57_01565 [Gemmatimonadota bacterium]|jgi:Spy/CpxP family protein refolding chaperone
MEKRQRTRLASALILTLVFASGAVVGFALDRAALASSPSDEAVASEDDAGERDERDRRRPMYEQVGELTDAQRSQIDAIVEAHRAARREMRDAWEDELQPVRDAMQAWEEEHVAPLRDKWEPRFDSLTRATRDRIRGVMTTQQAERYDSLLTEYEKRMEERRRDHDPGDDRGG